MMQHMNCRLNGFCASGATKLGVSNQGGFVILEVDGSNRLVVGMKSKEEEMLTGELRLALGGVLIDKEKMIVQVRLFQTAVYSAVRST